MCALLRREDIRNDREIADYGLPVADMTRTKARVSMTGLRILKDQKNELLIVEGKYVFSTENVLSAKTMTNLIDPNS